MGGFPLALHLLRRERAVVETNVVDHPQKLIGLVRLTDRQRRGATAHGRGSLAALARRLSVEIILVSAVNDHRDVDPLVQRHLTGAERPDVGAAGSGAEVQYAPGFRIQAVETGVAPFGQNALPLGAARAGVSLGIDPDSDRDLALDRQDGIVRHLDIITDTVELQRPGDHTVDPLRVADELSVIAVGRAVSHDRACPIVESPVPHQTGHGARRERRHHRMNTFPAHH